ncbi:bifunctional UDP-N-acetylmuramoyl-tripeptide:D-alanyl-D-alanine ligase/alanine racemase [Sphingobacterium sp. LRF_L2]|uniref:bifunctional UDP-N-acetylmuramoyl-tripeptide:D-alanyl-D-alanine ligase/alanine racemase n=1 Tax=Sphingobacterium sp. LRF_L2 TaxID=3369421 RepID=UPI003F6461A4
MYTIASILTHIDYERSYIFNDSQEIYDLAYDTRKIRSGTTSLFFALTSVRDGHDFIEDAYKKGVRSFVVSRNDIDTVGYENANFIFVNNVLFAMQQLAAYHRSQFDKPIIGITGSNGKTVVKEWLTQLLLPDKKVYQSPNSYNSQLGVALALWNLTDDYDCAIIEAGISLPEEMERLEAMIKPDIGIFTNIGLAHSSGFVSKELKLKEKLKLFKQTKHIIFSSLYPIREFLDSKHVAFSFGDSVDDDVRILKMEDSIGSGTAIQLEYRTEIATFDLPFQDRASIENSLTCLTTLLFFGYSLDAITHKLQRLQPLDMRLQLKTGKYNCSIIDDTYSNDLASLQIALDFLHQQQQHKKKTLILSDLEGLDDRFREKLLKLLQRQGLSRVILVGRSLAFLKAHLDVPTLLFESTEELLTNLEHITFDNESILIKGSRIFHLEDVSQMLSAKSHETVLEINLAALERNLQRYRSLLPTSVKLMAMVKAFSYGSGSYEVANLLQFNKVDYLTVAFADEGVELRQNGIELPVMVLSPDEQVFDNLVLYKLEPEIYSFRILNSFVSYLRARKITKFPIHVKIDTGMHRLGFLPTEVERLSTILVEAKEVQVKSVFSHLVASGNSEHDSFTLQQIDVFTKSVDHLENGIGYRVLRHIANTSAIVNWPNAYFDMVRLGIGLYGVDMDHRLGLDTVSTLKTTITQIKELDAGETVGYDRKGVLKRVSRIATVKIGYADGYSRRFGNGVGSMLLNGQRVSTVGSICMDMCMLDVTDVAAREEDEVFVFPDLMEAAKAIDTIPYELLVNISSRVKRVYFYG